MLDAVVAFALTGNVPEIDPDSEVSAVTISNVYDVGPVVLRTYSAWVEDIDTDSISYVKGYSALVELKTANARASPSSTTPTSPAVVADMVTLPVEDIMLPPAMKRAEPCGLSTNKNNRASPLEESIDVMLITASSLPGPKSTALPVLLVTSASIALEAVSYTHLTLPTKA